MNAFPNEGPATQIAAAHPRIRLPVEPYELRGSQRLRLPLARKGDCYRIFEPVMLKGTWILLTLRLM
jgi:hypothetical protein